MSEIMIQGTRRDLPEDEYDLQPGEYGKSPDGTWYCRVPVEDAPGKYFGLGNLNSHTVIEHEDGTITVSPSILVSHYEGRSWHGYLERGIWREV